MEIEILYEDRDITVAIKPPELLSERGNVCESFAERLAQRNPQSYVGVVHRLDRGVGGVMVYARNQETAAELSRAVAAHTVKKEYLAVIHGCPDEREGTLTDLLFFDRRCNKSFVVERARNGVKEAILHYRVLQTQENDSGEMLSLVQIELVTGRTHQIRVQFSSRRHPLLGDGKYGAHDRCPIALCSYRLTFPHPKTHKALCFTKAPVGEPWNLFELSAFFCKTAQA